MTASPSAFHAAADLVILVPEHAAAPLAFGAGELASYIDRLCGARASIRPHTAVADRATLIVGHADAALVTEPELGAHGPIAMPGPGLLALAGRTPREVLDAAYAVLTWWGCRWSPHGRAEETVPRLDELPLPAAPLRVPRRFEVTGYAADLMTWHATEPSLYAARIAEDRVLVDWMGKTGANRFLYIRHPVDDLLTIPALQGDLDRRGIGVDCGGHVIPPLVPRELFATHPEYFPCGPDGARTSNGNICTAQAGALDTASRTAVEWTVAHPEMAGLHIWGADLWRGGWCGCAACGSVSVHDQSLRLCNAVARALAAAGVPRPVYYLAYHDTIDAGLRLQPDPGVWVEFAPRERCYGHALDDPNCATNRRYATALERYAEQFDGRVRIFEYYADAILFCGCAVPLTTIIEADLAYFARLGVPEITMLQFGAVSRFAYPLNVVAFAAAAAAAPTGRQANADYCRRFGALASVVAAAYEAVERAMARVVRYGDIRRPPRGADAAAEAQRGLRAADGVLAQVIGTLGSPADARTRDFVEVLAYTRRVLAGVEAQCGNPDGAAAAAASFAAASAQARSWSGSTAGVWGTVDLPLLHELYDVVFRSP